MSYCPTLGRWNQPDPLGYVDGQNLYQYVVANPVTNVDPSGLLVEAVFNRRTGLLSVTDLDTGAAASLYGCFSKKGAPIPVGAYDILDHRNRTQGSTTRDPGWYRL